MRQYLNQEDFVNRLSDSAEELYQLFENKYLNLKSVSQTSVANFVSQLNTNEQRVNPKFIGLFCANIKEVAQTLELKLDGANVKDVDVVKKVILLKDVKVLKQLAEAIDIEESDRKEFVATVCSWLVPTYEGWTSL